MAGLIDIYNIALVTLGGEEMLDPAEDTVGGRLCRARYNTVRDAVLRAHPWNCALQRTTLTVDATPPSWGFANRYLLPADPYCLRVIGLADNAYVWKIEGRYLLTDEGSPLKIIYVGRIDEALFDASLTEAVGMRLAWAISYKLFQSRTKEEEARKSYKDLITDARSTDGQEGTVDGIIADELEMSRL